MTAHPGDLLAEAMALLCAVSAIGLLVSDATGVRTGVWIFKPLASTCFVLCGLASGAWTTVSGRWLLAGLALGALGDVSLIPKGSVTFLVGLLLFLAGHVAYLGAFATRGTDLSRAWPMLLLLGPALVLIGRWLWPHLKPAMKLPVAAYMLVISAMVYAASGTYLLSGNRAVLAGAVAFYLSDLSVARDSFVSPGFRNRLWGLPLYYFAQLVLALNWPPGVHV